MIDPAAVRRSLVTSATALVLLLVTAAPALAAPPGNDDPGSPVPITTLPFTETLDTTEATSQSEEPTSCNYGRAVWYVYTAPEQIRLGLNTVGSDYPAGVAVFKGSATNAGLIACQTGNPARLSFGAVAGETYYFMVSGSGGVLTFNVDVAKPPTNDDISAARTISSRLPFSHGMDATEATLDLSDPSCYGKARTVWYRYQKPAKSDAAKVVMKTYRSTYDTTLSVYTGSRSNLKQIACNNNAGSTRQSKVEFVSEPGKTYYVMVGSYNNQPAGQLLLTVKDAPLPLKFSVGIAGTGSVSTVTGRARITGTVSCSRVTRLRIGVSVRQKVGGTVVSGSDSKEIACKGKDTWSIWLGSSRAFKAGDAGVWMSASVPRQEKSVQENRVVRLVRCSSCM